MPPSLAWETWHGVPTGLSKPVLTSRGRPNRPLGRRRPGEVGLAPGTRAPAAAHVASFPCLTVSYPPGPGGGGRPPSKRSSILAFWPSRPYNGGLGRGRGCSPARRPGWQGDLALARSAARRAPADMGSPAAGLFSFRAGRLKRGLRRGYPRRGSWAGPRGRPRPEVALRRLSQPESAKADLVPLLP